ncbi:MAG: methionyl aminopeptidase [Lachnospiraceae bacterium]|nr:methionyl aminopeptidase [Lachnospiraceae bacterium]
MTLGRNDVCWCGSGRKYKACHLQFDDKIATYQRKGHIVPEHHMIKTPEQIQGIKESSVINIAVLDYLEEVVKEGMTTEEINHIVYQMTVERGGVPAPLDYEGYPKSVCTSIDEVVCHGIPSKDVVLKSGDIVNIDVSTEYKGYFSDSSRMFLIGEVSEEKKKLVQVTKECMELGLQQVKPWGFLGDVAAAINEHAMANGYSVVVEIGGHGIGLEFHEEPFVSYVAQRGTEMLMVPGMVFTIEPMVNMGSHEVEIDESDGWTVYTKDRLPSAQWEITVAVTETGYEVLTY